MNIDSVETIRKWAEPLADEEGLFLVDVELKHGKVPELWILVDSEENRGIRDECSRISRKLGECLVGVRVFKGRLRLKIFEACGQGGESRYPVFMFQNQPEAG